MISAALLVIGNEILSGRTQDKNIAYLAEKLNGAGIQLREVRVVPDVEGEIVDAVNALRAKFTYVFTSGGIGPTHDDITTACIAKAFGVPVIRHPEAERRLLAHYTPEQVNEARMKMADTPKDAELIDNPVSVAPGFRIENVFVMAGVPRIFQAMVDGILPSLKGGAVVMSRTVSAYVTEGTIAAELSVLQNDHPSTEIGSYPFVRDGRMGTSLVVRGIDEAELETVAMALGVLFRKHGGETLAEG